LMGLWQKNGAATELLLEEAADLLEQLGKQ
jgi:hypothetical protein